MKDNRFTIAYGIRNIANPRFDFSLPDEIGHFIPNKVIYNGFDLVGHETLPVSTMSPEHKVSFGITDELYDRIPMQFYTIDFTDVSIQGDFFSPYREIIQLKFFSCHEIDDG